MTTLLTRHEQSALLIRDKNKILAIDFGSLTAGETIASLPYHESVSQNFHSIGIFNLRRHKMPMALKPRLNVETMLRLLILRGFF